MIANLKHPGQVGVRLPLDLLHTLDSVCREMGLKRSEIIVAAVRKHLDCPAPADLAKRRKA